MATDPVLAGRPPLLPVVVDLLVERLAGPLASPLLLTGPLVEPLVEPLVGPLVEPLVGRLVEPLTSRPWELVVAELSAGPLLLRVAVVLQASLPLPSDCCCWDTLSGGATGRSAFDNRLVVAVALARKVLNLSQPLSRDAASSGDCPNTMVTVV